MRFVERQKGKSWKAKGDNSFDYLIKKGQFPPRFTISIIDASQDHETILINHRNTLEEAKEAAKNLEDFVNKNGWY